MQMKWGRIITLLVIVVAVIGIIVFFVGSGGANTSADEAAVRQDVTSFGGYLKNVSLLGNPTTVKNDIQSGFGQYVTPELISQWQNDIKHAPGKTTSSPWPDHIEITTISPQGAGYIVTGNIILMTSQELSHGGNAGTIPVVMQLLKQNDKWLIAVYQQQPPQPPTKAASST